MTRIINFSAFCFLACGIFNPAYSYIDMGTGSYVLQIVLASVFGALYALKIYWKRIVTLFKKENEIRPADTSNESTSEK